ncbi:MAG: hypothetical protein PHN16_03010 [Candidatus Omnitrophica bacterium]|jgi:hypothetical protein|nr:hypothetical protein [Candidatus Omnitrophota bacterium]
MKEYKEIRKKKTTLVSKDKKDAPRITLRLFDERDDRVGGMEDE